MDNQGGDDSQGTQRQSQVMMSSPMAAYGSSILALTNPQNELYKLELVLKGIYVDSQGNSIQGDPLVNQRGVNKIMGLVQSVVNQVTFLSALDRNEAFGCYETFVNALDLMLMLNCTQFGITYPESDRTTISAECVLHVFPSVTRGRDSDDKKFLSKGGMIQESHIVSQGGGGGSGQRSGVAAMLWPWGKK